MVEEQIVADRSSNDSQSASNASHNHSISLSGTTSNKSSNW